MVKRSIEQNRRSRNFDARNERIESGAEVKNQREQRRVQRGPRECWKWKANGQCWKGDICSFQHDQDKRGKSAPPPAPSPEPSTPQEVRNPARAKSPRGRSPSGRMSRLPCKEHLEGTCTNPSCEKWNSPRCLFYKTDKGCNFGEKCSYAHRQVDEQPSTEKPQKNGDNGAVALLKDTRQLGCVFQDMEPLKSICTGKPLTRASILRKSSVMMKPIRRVQFTKRYDVTQTFGTKNHRVE